MKTISIIIIVKNGEEFIEKALKSSTWADEIIILILEAQIKLLTLPKNIPKIFTHLISGLVSEFNVKMLKNSQSQIGYLCLMQTRKLALTYKSL